MWSVRTVCTHGMYTLLLAKTLKFANKTLKFANKTSIFANKSVYTQCVHRGCTVDTEHVHCMSAFIDMHTIGSATFCCENPCCTTRESCRLQRLRNMMVKYQYLLKALSCLTSTRSSAVGIAKHGLQAHHHGIYVTHHSVHGIHSFHGVEGLVQSQSQIPARFVLLFLT